MKRIKCNCVFLFCVALFLLIGCSSSNNPITPIDSDNDQIVAVNTLPVGVSDYDSDGNPLNGYGVLGLFEINVDIDSLTGDVHSLRGVSLTDVLEIVDITNFLAIAPCTDCVKLMGVEINSTGNVILRIGIKHPFAAGNITEPISGKNRGDLHVFNVEGQVLIESLSTTLFSGIDAFVDDLRLVNSDGLSPYLDGVLDPIIPTTATVHPYKLHFDDYSAGNFDAFYPMGFQSVTNPPPSGNLVMAMGSDYSVQQYEFDLSSGNLNFALAVGCTYGVSSDSYELRFTPEYRVPQHLKKAASEVTVRIVNNNLLPGDSLSSADLAIDVVDISQDVAVGTALDEMVSDSSVGGIDLEIPGILNSAVTVPLVNTGGTGHDESDPLTYEITIQNEQSAPVGIYPGLVKVADSYVPGQNTSPLLIGNDGIERVDPTQGPLLGLFAIAEFATYQVFDIEVAGTANDPPTAILLPNPVTIYEGNSVNWDGTTSTDTDGTIDLYEFDYVWDGVEANFVADESNATGTVISDPYPTEGTYTAGLRVTDDLGGLGYDSVEVTVEIYTGSCPNAPYAGGTISSNFTFDDWYDMDVHSEWEWESDAIIDADMLSTGDFICIYSDAETLVEGDLRYCPPDESGGVTSVGTDYPGERGVSIDVDSADLVVFVTSNLTHFDADDDNEVTLTQRIAASYDYFIVVDPFTGPSSAQTVNVGTTIMAIDIDAYDDVWVLDTDNIMRMYDKSAGYAEDTNRQFDLDTATTGAFTGQVYDFVINYYNEAFYVLTDGTDRCELWRFECDGIYNSNISGHANPLSNILSSSTSEVADIGIDNLDDSGNILTGAQDAQIVVIGGFWEDYYEDWETMVSRIDAELNQLMDTQDDYADGYGCIFFDQRGNELWGFERGYWACEYTERWYPPSGWQ